MTVNTKHLLYRVILIGGVIFALSINAFFIKNILCGLVFFGLYIGLTGWSAKNFLRQGFGFSSSPYLIFLGMFTSLAVLGFGASVVITLYVLSFFTIILLLLLNAILWEWVANYARLSNKMEADFVEPPSTRFTSTGYKKLSIVLVGVYLCGAFGGFFLLRASYSVERLITPWSVIHPVYIYLFAALTCLLGIIIYLRAFPKVILAACLVHSLLLHSYLPLTYEFFYVVDVWRHIAQETHIVHEEPPRKVVVSDAASRTLMQRIDPGMVAYAQEWGLVAIINRVTTASLLAINKWFGPLVWSLVFPLLIYEFMLVWKKKHHEAEWMVFVSFLPFVWQAGGAVTIPNSFGFLWWLLCVCGLFSHYRAPTQLKKIALVAAGILSGAGYTLYFILVWLGWALMIGLERLVSLQKKIRWLLIFVLTVALIFPGLDLVAGYSVFRHNGFFGQLKQLVASAISFYVAVGPRAVDTAAGNILINQVPKYAFVVNWFTVSRLWLIPFMVVFWGFFVAGLITLFRRTTLFSRWIGVFGVGVMLSYIIGRYTLVGEQILSKRLENVIAFFLVLIFCAGVVSCKKYSISISVQKIEIPLMLASIVLFSVVTSASYSLGPDTDTVSRDEYTAIESVWNEIKHESMHCVLADTHPLLVLEAFSGKEIVGGGFPIAQNFGQPERVRLFNQVRQFPTAEMWNEAHQLTHAKTCWLVIDKKQLSSNALKEFTQKQFQSFGSVIVWHD